MTAPAPLLERDVDPDPIAALDGADVYHYYHCDPDVGWCGIDLSGVEECPPKPGEVPCPLCQVACESNVCPVCDAVEVPE